METSEAARTSQKPDWDTLRRDFGNIPAEEGSFVVTDSPDGKRDATLNDYTTDKKWLKKFHGMTEEARTEDYEVGQQQVASTHSNRTKLRNRQTGEVEEIPEGFESPSHQKKFTTLRKHWNRWTAPKEEKVLRPSPPRIYTVNQWANDCPTCGYRTDRWRKDHIFGTRKAVADDCSRCVASFDVYRRGIA